MNNHIQLKKTRAILDSRNFQRRAVAPVIATLLLVAIAVVGGSTIFVFSQGVFADTQICCTPHIELIEILGYDATDGDTIQLHNPFVPTNATSGFERLNGLRFEEYVAVYLENHSVNKITLSEVLLAGKTFEYVNLGGADIPDFTVGFENLGDPEYIIVKEGINGTNYITIDSGVPEFQPGQRGTIIFAMDKNIQSGRDIQIKLSTTHGTVLVGTIIAGQKQVAFS